MAKPRTNAQAADYWAEGILALEPQAHITVNSVRVEGDWIYSFGHHFPMGVIERTESGRVKRVLLNRDSYTGTSGWANTGGDQSSVAMAAREAIERSRRSIELESVYLSTYALGGQRGQIRTIPRDGDPEPPWPYLEVPTYFFRTDPGPEPVQDRTNCVAGHAEDYSYQDVEYLTSVSPQGAELHVRPYWYSNGSMHAHYLSAKNGRIEWGEAQGWWQHYDHKPAGVEYKQCPCCASFQSVHGRWHERMHGSRWHHSNNAQYGYENFCELMDTYGSEANWREARREDWRRVQRGRQAHRDWIERNYIPLSAVSRGKYGVPKLAPGGYALRKDEAAYFLAKRNAERAERRRERQREAEERYRRQVERYKRGIRRRRRPTFEQRARDIVCELNGLATVIVAANSNVNPERQLEE